MLAVKSELDLAKYLDHFHTMTFKVDGTGILMANGQWQGVPQEGYELWVAAFQDLGNAVARTFGQENSSIFFPIALELHHVMVNAIPPGANSGWHVDPEPGRRFSRWHLPVTSNDDCLFEQEGELPIRMGIGWWHGPVEYWRRHRVSNSGKTGRAHLILDIA